MKSRFAFWLSGCLGLALALAGNAAAPPPALEELLQRIAASAGVEASFVEVKELAILAVPLESRGVIYFAPPGRFARFTVSPDFSALVVNGEEVRLREGRDGPETDLSGNPVARVVADNFIALFSGDRAKLDRLYEAEFRGEIARWELRLVPRHEPLAGVISSITLRGDSGSMREMAIEERDGDRTRTRFESVRSDRAFAAPELQRIFGAGVPLEGTGGEL